MFRWQNLPAMQVAGSACNSAEALEAGVSEGVYKHPQAVHRYRLCAPQGRGNLQGIGAQRSILYHQKVHKLLGLLTNNPEGLCELGVSFPYDSWLPDPNIGTTLKLWRPCTTALIYIALYFGLSQSHSVSHSLRLSRCARRSNMSCVQLGAEQ